MMLQETTARIAAELRRLHDAGECVEFSIDDVAVTPMTDDEGPFLRFAIHFADGGVLEVDSREGAHLLQQLVTH